MKVINAPCPQKLIIKITPTLFSDYLVFLHQHNERFEVKNLPFNLIVFFYQCPLKFPQGISLNKKILYSRVHLSTNFTSLPCEIGVLRMAIENE